MNYPSNKSPCYLISQFNFWYLPNKQNNKSYEIEKKGGREKGKGGKESNQAIHVILNFLAAALKKETNEINFNAVLFKSIYPNYYYNM